MICLMIDFSKLDKTIHERGRLSIMTLLATRVEWSFQDLKSELNMSDGNLVTHLRALGNKDYVAVRKETRARRPLSLYALTEDGRQAFTDYLEILEAIVRQGKD